MVEEDALVMMEVKKNERQPVEEDVTRWKH